MIQKQMSVEIHDNKRVDDNGQALYEPSGKVRLNKAKDVIDRASLTEKQLDECDFYNVYTGTVVEAEPSDFDTRESMIALATRIKTDLYAGLAIYDAVGALKDVLNNGGLRLAYGDAIKKQHKLAGNGGKDTKLVAGSWFMAKLTDGTAGVAEKAGYVAAGDKLGYVLGLWIAAGSPRS